MPILSKPSTGLFQKSTPPLPQNPSKAVFWGKALEQAGTATLRADTLHVSRTTTPTTPTRESSSPIMAPQDSHEVRGSNFKAAPQDPTQSSNTNGNHDDEPSSWGETKEFCVQMVNANQKSLGSTISPGTLSRIQINSTYSSSIPGSIFISQPEGYFESGSARPDSEASNRGGRQQSRFLQPSIRSSEEGWGMAPHNQFEAPQCLSEGIPFQDGEHNEPERYHLQGRPHDEDRLERCLSYYTNSQASQEIPTLSMARQEIPVQDSPVWPGYGSSYLHQASHPCSNRAQESGPSSDNLSGRYFANGIISRHPEESFSDAHAITTGAGVHIKPQEMCLAANSGDRVFGLSSELQYTLDFTTGGQNPQGPETVPQDPECRESIGKRASTTHWPTHISKPSNDACPIILPRAAEDENQPPYEMELIRSPSRSDCHIKRRSPLLDRQNSIIAGEEDNHSSCLPSHHLRCFHSGLGSELFRLSDRRSMDTDGSTGPHKCSGAPSSLPGSEDLCKQPVEPAYSSIDRQHNGSVIHQSKGWHDIQNTVRPRDPDVAVVHGEKPHHSCGAYSGSSQCESRRRVKEPPPLIRLETRPRSLQEAHEQVGIVHNRSICSKAQYPVIKILQFPSGSGGRSIRCSSPELEGREAICFSPIHLDWEIPAEVEAGQSQGSNPHSPSVATPSLVPTIDRLSDRPPTDPPVRQTTADESNGSSSPDDNSGLPASSRISCVRAQYGEISEEAFKIISSAWRKGTEKSYSSTWKKWVEWCSRCQANSLSPSLKDVIQFLTEEFMHGRQYSTINSYRSALSATLPPIDGYQVGSHPTVCKLLQGMFNQRPPAPKYKSVWSVSTVLDFVSKKLSTESLSLKQLSKKLAVLLALTNASCSSDLHALDLDYRQFTPEGVLFRIPGLTKTRRSGPPKEAFFTSFGRILGYVQ